MAYLTGSVQGAASAPAAPLSLRRMGALRSCVVTLLREDGLTAGLFRGWWPTVWVGDFHPRMICRHPSL